MQFTITPAIEVSKVFDIAMKGDIEGGPDGSRLHDLFREKVEGQEGVIFIADLSQVRFMNASGLGMLISMMTAARHRKGDILLTHVADRIEALLIITKLITVFKHFDTRDEALEWVAKRRQEELFPKE